MIKGWKRAGAAAMLAAAGCFGLSACGGGGQEELEAAGLNIGAIQGEGVNKYLWTATLETLNFMPLDFADPYGGLVSTEWYANPEAPAERFRATVYILDSRLRADALRVSVFRQQQQNALWVDAPVNGATAAQIENAILTRARQLRLDSIE